MSRIGFKFRLNLLITAVFAASVILGGALAVRNYRLAIAAETEASAQLVVGLVAASQGLISSAREAEQFQRHLIHEIPELTHLRHVRLEVFDNTGKSLIRSQLSNSDEANPAPRWFRALVSPPSHSYQVPLGPHFSPSGVIMVATDPDDEVTEEWTNTRDLMTVVGVFFLGLWTMVLCYINFALRPMDELHGALEALGGGENVRARVFGSPELAKINRQFNRMADALANANNENQTLNQRLINLRDEERRAIARELHDNLAQYLFAIRTDAFAIEQMAETVGARSVIDAVRSISDSASRMETVVREMIQQLRPLVLDELGLQDALRDLVATWRIRNPRVECILESESPTVGVSAETELAIYHVVQESLTNVAKHSGASRARVSIRVPIKPADAIAGASGDENLEVIVEDNGRGVNSSATASGMGLVGMRERIEILGGSLATVYRAGTGWSVTARIPLSSGKSAEAA